MLTRINAKLMPLAAPPEDQLVNNIKIVINVFDNSPLDKMKYSTMNILAQVVMSIIFSYRSLTASGSSTMQSSGKWSL